MEDNHNKTAHIQNKNLYTLTSEHQINMTAGSHFNPDINYALHETHEDILQQHPNISTPTAK